MSIIRYELSFNLTFPYLEERLKNVNNLSSQILKKNKWEKGSFFSYLPINTNEELIHKFTWYNISIGVKKYVYKKIFEAIHFQSNICCIFDEATFHACEMQDDSLFINFGACYQDEIYYILNKKRSNYENISACFCASDAIWHSLCVLSKMDFEIPCDRKLSKQNLQEFCENAKLIIVGAYDGEGYIFWERNSTDLDKEHTPQEFLNDKIYTQTS